MDNRKYNLFFHLHTVSGISITVMLFVIFFAGAFTLFKDEINAWEKFDGKAERTTAVTHETYYKAFAKAQKEFPAQYGRSVSLVEREGELAVNVGYAEDETLSEEEAEGGEFTYHAKDDSFSEREEYFGTGTFLYWLHFYWQFGEIGYLIAGFVSLFFFLAIVTGILVHWKKIRSNFFTFRPLAKWKTIWTDAHTALGVIGLPFQFLYALTGSMFGLGLLLSWTVAASFFDNNVDNFYKDYYPLYGQQLGEPDTSNRVDLSYFVNETRKRWGDYDLGYVLVSNLGSDSATVEINGNLPVKTEFLGFGQVIYDVKTGRVVHETDPHATNYIDNTRNWMFKVHYAKFGDIGTTGNVLVKTAYFLLALLSCFVIMTGVMIWLTARNKKGLDPKKKKWNSGVGYFYLSSCLSMFPLVGYTMIVSKFSETHTEDYLNYVFFSMWAVVSILLAFLRSNKKIFRITLLSGGVFSLLVPVAGAVSGGNMFTAYASGHLGVFAVDVIFTLLGLMAFFTYWRVWVAAKRREAL